jgi:hypothetical protein
MKPTDAILIGWMLACMAGVLGGVLAMEMPCLKLAIFLATVTVLFTVPIYLIVEYG